MICSIGGWVQNHFERPPSLMAMTDGCRWRLAGQTALTGLPMGRVQVYMLVLSLFLCRHLFVLSLFSCRYVSSVLVLMQVKLLPSLFSCRYMLVLSFSRVACKSHSGGMSICRESGYTADGQLLWLPSSSWAPLKWWLQSSSADSCLCCDSLSTVSVLATNSNWQARSTLSSTPQTLTAVCLCYS